jgi:tetratricopeptide (TPR) repeat protein
MKNYNMAVKNFDKCISLNPKNPLAYYGLGNCLIELKNFPEAYKNLTKSA